MLDKLDVTEQVRAVLERDKWTFEALATIDPEVLESYRGIGKVTAQKIVEQSKKLMPQPRPYRPTAHIQLGKSVRIRRIEESQK